MEPDPDLLEEAVKGGECSEGLAKLLRKRLSKIFEPLGHPKTVLDTEDWQLTAVVKFIPKTRQVPCPGCNGSRKRQIGFGMDMDEDTNDDKCKRCFGHGTVTYHPDEATRPVVPEDLLKGLHEVWKAYSAEHEAKKDKISPDPAQLAAILLTTGTPEQKEQAIDWMVGPNWSRDKGAVKPEGG